MNLSNNLLRAAKYFPNKPALREDKLELSYSQLNEKVNRTANTLVNLGVKPGDLVGLCMPNSIDWIIIGSDPLIVDK
jgi:long-chain acyl-CoA synthetase